MFKFLLNSTSVHVKINVAKSCFSICALRCVFLFALSKTETKRNKKELRFLLCYWLSSYNSAYIYQRVNKANHSSLGMLHQEHHPPKEKITQKYIFNSQCQIYYIQVETNKVQCIKFKAVLPQQCQETQTSFGVDQNMTKEKVYK